MKKERLTERVGDGIRYKDGKYIVTCYPKNNNLSDVDKIAVKLCELEDKIENGTLLELPCKIGTHLWKVTYPYRQEPKVTEFVVKNFRTVGKRHKIQVEVQAVNVPATNWMYYTAFHETKEEAEKELAERREG